MSDTPSVFGLDSEFVDFLVAVVEERVFQHAAVRTVGDDLELADVAGAGGGLADGVRCQKERNEEKGDNVSHDEDLSF